MRLLDVTPGLTGTNSMNYLMVDTVPSRKFSVSEFALADCYHIRFFKLRSAICFAQRSSASSAFNPIPCIVAIRSYIKVLRIYATRIVAVVQDMASIRNRSPIEYPCRTMRFGVFTFSEPKRTIPFLSVYGSSPYPAIVSLYDLLHKTLLNRSFWPAHPYRFFGSVFPFHVAELPVNLGAV